MSEIKKNKIFMTFRMYSEGYLVQFSASSPCQITLVGTGKKIWPMYGLGLTNVRSHLDFRPIHLPVEMEKTVTETLWHDITHYKSFLQ